MHFGDTGKFNQGHRSWGSCISSRLCRRRLQVSLFGGRKFSNAADRGRKFMAMNMSVERRAAERRVYLIAAVVFAVLVLAGFARTYYLKVFFAAPPLASGLVHLHGVVMTAWVGLFIAQVYLIRSKNIKVHMSLGLVGIALAVVVFVVGMAAGIAQAGRGGTPLPEIPPLSFLAVPFFDMVIFAILLGGAIFYRKRPANHKRLMLLTVFNFLPAAAARLPFPSLTAYGPVWFFGFPDVLALIFLGVDTWQNKKVNVVFALGTLLLIASHPLRIIISGTDAWLRFAGAITG